MTTSSDDALAPDGGWGWLIVAAAQVLNILIGGAVNSFGVTYLHLLDLHQQSAGDTAWIGSMANALGLLLAPISSALCVKFSCCTVVVVGGILTFLAWVISALVKQFVYLYVTYGLLAGIGMSMSYTPSFVVIGMWFDKRKSLAYGLAVAGAGIGTFLFAPILQILLTSYGFQGTMLIMGAVMLHICVCGAFFRSVPKQRQKLKWKVGVKCGEHGSDKSGTENSTIYVLPFDKHHGRYTENTTSSAFEKEHFKQIDNVTIKVNFDHPLKEANHHVQAGNLKTSEVRNFLDYTLIRNPLFLCFGLSMMCGTLGRSSVAMMLPLLAQQHNHSSEDSTFLISILGVADILGRVGFGALSDLKYIKDYRKYLYVFSLCASGIASTVIASASDFGVVAAYCYSMVFGVFAGCYHALTPVIVVDMLGAERLSRSMGLALLFQGLGYLLGPPIAGCLKDGSGSYQSSLYFAGVSMIVGSFVMSIPSVTSIYMLSKSK